MTTEIDAKTAEVLTSALEKTVKTEDDSKVDTELKHESIAQKAADDIQSGIEAKALSKASTHKAFSIDLDLNGVGVGIVPGISGPKTTRQAFESVDEGLETCACTRCKKEFPIDLTGKTFKLCPHCRELQRERSRRWQQKTKLKPGACRRCGVSIPTDQAHFVLCPPCRLSLRTRKASRYENGKCVHCSGINDSTEFKVCSRCRNNDKLRRKNLEERGCCNRCAHPLKDDDKSHKVCSNCRSRKKTVAKASAVSQHHEAAMTAAAAAQAAAPEVTVAYQQQVAQQLEANLFAQEEGSSSVANDESMQALAQATQATSAQSS